MGLFTGLYFIFSVQISFWVGRVYSSSAPELIGSVLPLFRRTHYLELVYGTFCISNEGFYNPASRKAVVDVHPGPWQHP